MLEDLVASLCADRQGAVGQTANLHPENPGEGLLAPADWVQISTQLRLTARELSVAVLMFEGRSRLQIANQLSCAPGTVRVYIDRLFAKLHVQDRLGMALRVIRIYLTMRRQPNRGNDTVTDLPIYPAPA